MGCLYQFMEAAKVYGGSNVSCLILLIVLVAGDVECC